MLDKYIQYAFDVEQIPDFPIFFCRCWTSALKDFGGRNNFRYSQYLFAILSKALALQARNQGYLGTFSLLWCEAISQPDLTSENEARTSRFQVEQAHLQSVVELMATAAHEYRLVEVLDTEIGRLLNTNLAHFISELAAIINRNDLFDFVCLIESGYYITDR